MRIISRTFCMQLIFGDPKHMMKEEDLMVIIRGLSATEILGDDQRKLRECLDFEAGKDRTGDLEPWENLIKTLSAPFICPMSTVMKYDYHYNSQIESGTIVKQKNPKKGRSGPLADAVYSADLIFLVAFALRRLGGDESVIPSVK